MSECYYCGPTKQELRPYGPGGRNICFPCMKASPEREETAKANFMALLDGVGAMTGIVSIGTDAGPQPVVLEIDDECGIEKTIAELKDYGPDGCL